MSSRFSKIFNICKVLFVFGLISLIVFVVVNGIIGVFNVGPVDVDINSGNFGKNPVWLQNANNKDATDIVANADLSTTNGKMDAVYDLYTLALKRLALVEKYASIAAGEMQFSMGSLAGGETSTLIVRNFEKIGTPTLNPNQKYKYDYQNYVVFMGATEGTSSLVAGILKDTSDKALREYCDGTTIYANTGTSPKIIESVGSAEWYDDITESPVTASPSYRSYDEGELREISNFVINPETIDGETIVIATRVEEDATYYDISFDLICSPADTNKIGSSVYYEAQSTMSTTSGLQLEYNSVSITMTICENGYMTHFSNIAQTNVIFNIIVPMNGPSTIKFSEAYSYDPEEVNIVDFR